VVEGSGADALSPADEINDAESASEATTEDEQDNNNNNNNNNSDAVSSTSSSAATRRAQRHRQRRAGQSIRVGEKASFALDDVSDIRTAPEVFVVVVVVVVVVVKSNCVVVDRLAM
jgi:cobalamin biosynthesis Mg chelatase CobN